MKIGIHTWGNEGDIHPFLALAGGLAQAGHEVRLAYSAADGRDYSASLTDVGYAHTQLSSPQSPGDLYRIGEEVLSESSPRRQLSQLIRELLDPVLDALTQSATELAKWADVLVLHPMAHPLSAAAELERKPFVCVYTAPGVATRAFPPLGLPHLGTFNLLAWKLVMARLSAKTLCSINGVRERLGLAHVQRAQQQLHRSAIDLIAMSPTLLPRPRDWPEKVHLTGFLNPPPPSWREKLAPELKAFLAEGPAPVCVTFGSMSGLERNPHMLIELAEEALAAAGCRAIVQSAGPTHSSSSHVFRVSALAPDQVFPKCSVIVHHGGAGTTQAALRAGCPSVVVAHITDQFAWGRRLYKLGVAPPHLNRGGLEPKQLLRAIERATQDPAMRAQAERLGEQLRREDGVQRAVELISLQGSASARSSS